MAINGKPSTKLSEFLQYLALRNSSGEERLPSLAELSQELGVSVASLREQMEVARSLGLIEVKPKRGIRWLPYQFTPSILISLAYAIKVSPDYFDQFRDFRNHLEAAYYYEAVTLLNPFEINQLLDVVVKAENYIGSMPPQNPHHEHRRLHRLLFNHINNTYVQGVFDAYWEIYEAVGLSIISDLEYLQRVWSYHRRFVEEIKNGNINESYQIFLEHKELLIRNPKPIPSQTFE